MAQPQSSSRPSRLTNPPDATPQPDDELPRWLIALLGLALGAATSVISLIVTTLIHSMLPGQRQIIDGRTGDLEDLLDPGNYPTSWHATLAVTAAAVGLLIMLMYGARRSAWAALLAPLLFWALTSMLHVGYQLAYQQRLWMWTLTGVTMAPVCYALAVLVATRLPLTARRAAALRAGVVGLAAAIIAAGTPLSAALPTLRREHDFREIAFVVAYPLVAGYEPTAAHLSVDRRSVTVELDPVTPAAGQAGSGRQSHITVTATAGDVQHDCRLPSGWLQPSPAPSGRQADLTCRDVAPDRWQTGAPDRPVVIVAYRNSRITYQSPSEPPVAAHLLLTAELRELSAADLAAIAY